MQPIPTQDRRPSPCLPAVRATARPRRITGPRLTALGGLLMLGLLTALPGVPYAQVSTNAEAERRGPGHDDDFITAGVVGRYALVLTGKGGRTPTAGVGVVRFDAKGNVSGSTTVNVPEAVSVTQRHFAVIPIRGHYVLHPDGTGKITLLEEAVKEATFLITKFERPVSPHARRSLKLAREISVIGKDPGAYAGNLITVTLTRLPDDDEGFTTEAQAGKLSIVVTAVGGTTAIAGQILATTDAQGNFAGRTKYNIVNAQTGARTFIEFPTTGTFTINPDGTGKLQFTGAGVVVKEAVFVVTKAERRAVRRGHRFYDDEQVALELMLVAKELNGQGHLLTGVATRLPEETGR